jgi:hypothetical protein
MNVEPLILTIGLSVLCYAIGYFRGKENTHNNIQEAFRSEGYSLSKFREVIDRLNNQ